MGRHLALLIATYHYQDTGLRQLTAPAHDAEALAAVLRDPAIAGFEVTTLVNEPHHRVGEAIGDFYRDRRRDDLTLLYFTGHGLKDDDGQLYLAMTNTRRDSLLFTALSAVQVGQAMEGCTSRQKVLVLDCCYSGAFPADRIAKADTAVHALERFQGRGRTVLTASDATQYSFEGNQPHGQAAQSVFTRYLVAGLRDGSADLDGDGDITIDELYSYVHDRVVEEMPQQRPKKLDNVEGRTVIAKNINWTLPAYLRNAIGSPIATDRLAALDGLAHLHRIGNSTVRSHVRDEIRRLADDDSRLVSAAAAMSLKSVLPQPPEPPGDQPPAPVPGKPEQATRTPPDINPDPATAPERSSHVLDPAAPVGGSPSPVRPSGQVTPARGPLPPVSPAAPVPGTPSRPQPDAPLPAAHSAEPELPAPAPLHQAACAAGPAASQGSRLGPRTRRAKALIKACAGALTLVIAVLLIRNLGEQSSGGAASPGPPAAGLSPSGSPGQPAAVLFTGDTDPVNGMAFSPDGTALAAESSSVGTVGSGGTVRVWNAATGQATATITLTGNPGYILAFSPDGKTLATTSFPDRGPGAVRLWNVATGQLKATLPLTGNPSYILAFSPDGNTLATASTMAAVKSYNNPVQLWNVATGQPMATLTGHTNGIESLAFSPDGKTLASGGGGGPSPVWTVATRQPQPTLTRAITDDGVSQVAFSPDSKTLATVSPSGSGGTVRLWNVATGRRTTTFTDHTAPVYCVGFRLDNEALAATGGGDGTVRLWNVATGQITATLTGQADSVSSAAFSPDGKTLAAGSDNGTVRLWDISARG